MTGPILRLAAVAALLAQAACLPSGPQVSRTATPATPPAGQAPRGEVFCMVRATTPAVVETVTEQVMVTPAALNADGSVARPAVYRTETRQAITRDRREVAFESPCPERMTPDFVASLQRALRVRGHYDGPITGEMDARTGAAIRAFQAARGDHDTAVLTLASARALGLIALDRAVLLAE